jgi:SagB-type dehydrogenase family enzyme
MTSRLRPVVLLVALALLAASVGRQTVGQREPAEPRALPAPRLKGTVSVEEALARRRSVRQFTPTPLSWDEIGQLAWAAQGITEPARKLRTAPSAGALYPLEVYLVTPEGAYHYLPEGHRVERLSDRDARSALGAGASAAQAPLVIVLAAVYERTRARFGDQAERYVYMEAGHVAENIQLQAVAMGLGSVTIGGAREEEVRTALGLPEDQHTLYVIPVGHPVGSGQ